MTDSLTKIFVSILNECLQCVCDTDLIIEESQAGSCTTYSTIDHIFSLHAATEWYVCKHKGRFDCLFVDLSKAFLHSKTLLISV